MFVGFLVLVNVEEVTEDGLKECGVNECDVKRA
jgi:hypothetical protein